MPLFGRRHQHRDYNHDHTDYGPSHRHNHRRHYVKDPDRVAAGYRAALSNPNTTHEGREHAKHELHSMGYSAHVSLMTKIKRALGIRSSPRRHERSSDPSRQRRDYY